MHRKGKFIVPKREQARATTTQIRGDSTHWRRWRRWFPERCPAAPLLVFPVQGHRPARTLFWCDDG
jgi:hypothetical protein